MNKVVARQTWGEYLRRITQGDTQVQIAARVGTDQKVISRWMRNLHRPQPDAAAQVARAYGRNPLEALVAADWVTPEEIADIPIEVIERSPLEVVSDDELIEELRRRIDAANARRAPGWRKKLPKLEIDPEDNEPL